MDSMSNEIKLALKAGYKYIDSAWISFVDHVVGKAVIQTLSECRNIKREDLFLVSKLWNTHHSRKNVHKIVDDTLLFMNQAYLDCMFIHWPMGFKVYKFYLNIKKKNIFNV